MVNKPVIFISSTSDLHVARELVGKVLYSMGYEPVWQEIEATDGGELLGVLRRRIEPCSLVVQLVGHRYGAEPMTYTPEFGRVSYTQFEALYAEKLGRKVIYHFIDPAFPCDAASPEAEDRRDLQTAYRHRIKDANKLRQSHITTTQDLELSIRRINDELAAVRKQTDRRFRKMLWLTAGAVAGVAVVAALVVEVLHRQARTDVQVVVQTSEVKNDIAALREELRAAVAPKALAQGQTAPEPLSPELVEKAKILLERGTAEDQALAQIALKRYDEANRIIQDLKKKPGNPIDDAVRLLTLEAENWYQSGAPDKAVEPCDQALALHPTDVKVRNNAAYVHTYARLGDLGAHRKRSIEICQGTLKLVPTASSEWAFTQYNLGLAWGELPTGDSGENIRKAIACYDAALTVFTTDGSPKGWAVVQDQLGVAWSDLPTGDRAENFRKAIACFDAAFTVRTRKANPFGWAKTQYNLGNAWNKHPADDSGENYQKAIDCYVVALTVFTKDFDPTRWAVTQTNLGSAWRNLPTGNRGENFRKAIACFEATLTVCTKEADPANWAIAQNNLGGAWGTMPTGDRGENFRKAIACYENAVTVFTKQADPTRWAKTQCNLGIAWTALSAGDHRENARKAIACYENALTVYSRDSAPIDWAATQYGLGTAWTVLPTGDLRENYRKAIACYENALTVYSKDSTPSDWASIQYNLGVAWSAVPAGDRRENLRRAIACHQAALAVYTMEAFPERSLSLRITVSALQLLIKDFEGSLVTIEPAEAVNPQNLTLATVHADALLFLGRVDEAKAIYLKHVDEKVDGKTWQAMLLLHFDSLEKQGLTHPQLDDIRALLRAKKDTATEP